MTGTTADEIREMTTIMTELALAGDRAVAICAVIASAALVCVCHDMTDEEIRKLFDRALGEARAADGAAQKRGSH